MRVLQVESVGGHRGMHYYDMNLGNGLAAQGVDLRLWTSDETQVDEAWHFPVTLAFRGIFRGAAILRGLRYLRTLWRLAKLCPHPQGEVLHFHIFQIPLADLVALRWLKRQGFKIVITAHDVVPFDRGATPTLGRLYAVADRIIVHTTQSRDEIMTLFPLEPERVVVIPHGNYMPNLGALPSQSAAKERLGVSPQDPLLLFFGQIKRVKGLDYLLKALPAVLGQHSNAKLCIAGAIWKDDWSRYQALIDELGLAEHLLLHIGHVPDDQVASYFRAADLVALPYLKIYQSGVLLMACSYGTPVVATDTGGLAEALRHGETGLLVPPRDVDALAMAINDLLSAPSRAQAMGQAAQRWVEEAYSWPSIAVRTCALYQEVLSE